MTVSYPHLWQAYGTVGIVRSYLAVLPRLQKPTFWEKSMERWKGEQASSLHIVLAEYRHPRLHREPGSRKGASRCHQRPLFYEGAHSDRTSGRRYHPRS